MAEFDTLRVRAGYSSKENNWAVNVPIYQTTAFDLGDPATAEKRWAMEDLDAIYTRCANPTVTALEERVRIMSGAGSCVAFSSGMAAISNTILALTEGGGNIVSSNALYGGSASSFSEFLGKFGAEIRFAENRFDPDSYAAATDENTRGFYLETISNPNGEVYDLKAFAEKAHSLGVLLIVDNTVATPYLLNPFDYGADIVIYSATKGLSGHGNTLAGLMLESGKAVYRRDKFPSLYTKSWKIRDSKNHPRSPYDVDPKSPLQIQLRGFYLEFIGASLTPFDAFLTIQGLDTISERLKKESENALRIAEFLESRIGKEVTFVNYAGLEDSPYHSLAEEYLPKGAGGILSFGFHGDEEQLTRFFGALKYFSYHVNIGDVRSLITNVTKTTHAELQPEQLKAAGISENTVRISAGIEDPEDLIGDLKQALDRTFHVKNRGETICRRFPAESSRSAIVN